MHNDKPSLPKVVDDCHELLKWLIPQLDKFPRNRRFTLGERIEHGMIEVLEECIEAAYRRDKTANLETANRRLSAIRHLWRLAFELRTISRRHYQYGSERLVEIGRQIGGWRRAQPS
jgi:hypothetical protein